MTIPEVINGPRAARLGWRLGGAWLGTGGFDTGGSFTRLRLRVGGGCLGVVWGKCGVLDRVGSGLR